MAQPEEIVVEQICGDCGKVRTSEPDYSAIQPILGQPLGWYDGEEAGEGHLCPDCMVKLMKLGNPNFDYTAAKPL